MIKYDWRFPEPDNVERLESVAKGLSEMLEIVRASLGLLLAGIRARHGNEAYGEIIRRIDVDQSTSETLMDAYRKLREQIDEEAGEAGGPGLVVSFSLPQGDLADDFGWWIGSYHDRITPAMLADVLQPEEIEELLPILHERLAESELRETINQKVCCFFCGNGFYEPDEPCQICADHLRTGCILVGLQDGETVRVKMDRRHLPKRTGKCFRVSNDFIREHWPDDADAIVSNQGMYIDERDARRLGLE